MTVPTIADYYKDKYILVTGATGFIGKVFIAKLLTECPDIAGIYCLVRPKKGRNASQRISDLTHNQVFEKLRSMNPDFEQKLHAVAGDISQAGLGLNDQDRELVQQIIHVVFHSAATVRFDEPLRIAVDLNMIGLRRMIELAKKMGQLEAFVHVSTAYSNCDRQHIEEKIYPSHMQPQQLIDMVGWMDDATLNAVTPHLLKHVPNTYTYTKQLGETLLMQEGATLPLVIVRPSIVTSAWKEPMPGWIDNYNGLSGVCIAGGKGLLRSMRQDPDITADLLPVDFCANGMIVCGWHRAVHTPAHNGMVYHLTSGHLNPVTWGDVEVFGTKALDTLHFDNAFRRPTHQYIHKNTLLDKYWMLVGLTIPAYAVDAVLALLGKQPKLTKVASQMRKAMDSFEYFCLHSWQWTHNNIDALRTELTAQDHKTFYVDIQQVDWEAYMHNLMVGVKKYMLKEDMENMDSARAHLNTLRNIRYVFNTLLLVITWRFLFAKSQIVRNFRGIVLGLFYDFLNIFRKIKNR